MALGYSSIDEAWGMSAEPSRRVRKPKQKKAPPAPDAPPEPHAPCHLYEQPVVDDIFSMYQPYSDVPALADRDFQIHPPPASVFPDPDPEPPAAPDAPPVDPSPWLANRLDDPTHVAFWEFMAFAFFGVLLIVLMENLVQIGMALRSPI
jgi:hypothetical protein